MVTSLTAQFLKFNVSHLNDLHKCFSVRYEKKYLFSIVEKSFDIVV